MDGSAELRQDRVMAQNESGLFAFLLGLGVGVGLALLLAPQAGEETRELIAEKAREGMAQAIDAAEDLKLQIEEGWSNTGELAQRLKDRVEEAVAEAREKVEQ